MHPFAQIGERGGERQVHIYYGPACLSISHKKYFQGNQVHPDSGRRILQGSVHRSIRSSISSSVLVPTVQTTLIGVGGGVVTDITGYVASVYMRGIPFGFVPTSILGMVDASIGGKNGIDVGNYKNMVGVIRQPGFLFYDVIPVADPACRRMGEWICRSDQTCRD